MMPSLCLPRLTSSKGQAGAFDTKRRVSLVEHGKAAEVMERLKRRSTGTTAEPDAETPWADLPDGSERRMSAAHNHHNYNPKVHAEEINNCTEEERAEAAEHDKTINDLAQECSTMVDTDGVGDTQGKQRRRSLRDILLPKPSAPVVSLPLQVEEAEEQGEGPPSTTQEGAVVEKPPNEDVKVRRGSILNWHLPSQTVVIFDWDDTIFPTSWVKWCHPHLQWSKPCPKDPKYRKPLRECAKSAARLLREAKACANVGIVTLATQPWCTISVRNFMPELEDTIEELQIPIMYARMTVDKQVAADIKASGYCLNTIKKQRAMNFMLSRFYGEYRGQSWKNTISIGDARYERHALLNAVSEHHNNFKPCKTKTIKMMSGPEIEQLTAQHKILCAWLPFIVTKKQDFNIDLDNDSNLLRAHHKFFTGEDVDRLGRPLPKAEATEASRGEKSTSAEAARGETELSDDVPQYEVHTGGGIAIDPVNGVATYTEGPIVVGGTPGLSKYVGHACDATLAPNSVAQ
ncbi:hypothetical protein FOL46_001644 [Perkinsus olseni]|uniref:Uncharacterized protein n=1 Tax=Perkinsus olseni TaxID=32597 RepID=A0A7J6MBX8_PEROL|nr:hypothetical protein FOL46_001644 [Perkinsus olseni]